MIGVILQTASVNIAMFLVARLFLGYGIPFCISGASQLIAELCYPREAGVLNGLFNESWYAGDILNVFHMGVANPKLGPNRTESITTYIYLVHPRKSSVPHL